MRIKGRENKSANGYDTLPYPLKGKEDLVLLRLVFIVINRFVLSPDNVWNKKHSEHNKPNIRKSDLHINYPQINRSNCNIAACIKMLILL